MEKPYPLTLTPDDRKAIDWIGHRYFHGDELYSILWDGYEGDIEWNDMVDITFEVSETAAWEIQDGIESEDDELACFSPELRRKLIDFCERDSHFRWFN